MTLSGGLIFLIYPLQGKLYSGKQFKDFSVLMNAPNELKGDITGRIAKNCRSSDVKKSDALGGANKITDKFIDNCLSEKSERPLVALYWFSKTEIS